MSQASPKLQIRIVPVTPLQQNCSLIWNDETKHAVLVDPGGEADKLIGALEHFGLTLTRMWLTHGHLDHAGAAAALRERTGVAVEGPHRDDQFWLDRIEDDAQRYGLSDLRNVTPDRYFEDGETLEFEGARFDVLHTPGHTPDSICLVVSDRRRSEAPWFVLTGDTLFVGSAGRPDLAGREAEMAAQLHDTLHRRLLTLPAEVELYPGHTSGSACGAGLSGKPVSTVGFERRWNPMLAMNRDDFVAALTAVIPPRPAEMARMVAFNLGA